MRHWVGPEPLPRTGVAAQEACRPANHASPLDSAALCQVYDSIFLDVPMSRVKFNVNSEYAYIQNFKVLQSTSPRPVPPFVDLAQVS